MLGPRDLDRDIEAIIDADDAATRQAAVRNLQAAGGSLREDVPSLVEATVLNALRRWFAVLFWFLLLGPAGALGYRLLALMAESPMRARVPVEPLALAQRLLGWIEWPVAQLMAFSMALVGNFDTARKAWRGRMASGWPAPSGSWARWRGPASTPSCAKMRTITPRPGCCRCGSGCRTCVMR